MDHIEYLDAGFEMQMLNVLIEHGPDEIAWLPKDWYEKFMEYMLKNELYEHIPKLEAVKHKVRDETFEEWYDRISKK